MIAIRHCARAALALLLAGLAIPLAAQQPTTAQQNAIRQNCRADFQAKCPGVSPGGSAALSCLQQNATSVSAPCQKALAAIGGGSGKSSTQPPASSTAPSTGSSTSGSATSAMPPLSPRQQLYIVRQACGMDFQTNCHGVPLGGGRAIACLQSHADTLSPKCQQALSSARQGG